MKTQLQNRSLIFFITKRLFVLVAMLNLSIASAQIFTENGIKYEILPSSTNVRVVENSPKYTGEIIIPDSVLYNSVTYTVTSIDDQAFYYCPGLTSVTIGNSVTIIGVDAFYNSPNLTSVSIGNSVTIIKRRAFADCTSLISIVIPNSVTTIEENVFNNCTALTSATIGNSVTSIGDFAFEQCSSLTSIALPDSLSYINILTFLNCSSLTTLTIGNAITHIGGQAFSGCTSLTTVNCATELPIYINATVFNNVNQGMCALNVPPGSENAYQAAAIWQNFNPINGTLNADSVVNKNTIKLYPNPVSNTLNVERTFAGNQQLEVINNLGQIVLKLNSNSSEVSLDVTNLSKGIYFLNINSEEGNFETVKFIKN